LSTLCFSTHPETGPTCLGRASSQTMLPRSEQLFFLRTSVGLASTRCPSAVLLALIVVVRAAHGAVAQVESSDGQFLLIGDSTTPRFPNVSTVSKQGSMHAHVLLDSSAACAAPLGLEAVPATTGTSPAALAPLCTRPSTCCADKQSRNSPIKNTSDNTYGWQARFRAKHFLPVVPSGLRQRPLQPAVLIPQIQHMSILRLRGSLG
jgi:hypothetical protein